MENLNLDFSRNPYYSDDEVKAAAKAVYESDNWESVEDECEILMKAAGIEWDDVYAQYGADDADGTLFERTMFAVADFLGVELY